MSDHGRYPDDHIRSILARMRTIAVIGASANSVRPSYFVMKYLLEKGYRIIPINPGHAGREILGQTVFARLSDVPEPIDMVDIFRAAEAVPGIVEEALKLEPLPKVIWMQLGIVNEAAARTAEAAGISVIMNRCPKIEYGRLSGEIGWAGVNRGVLSSRRPNLSGTGHQHLSLGDPQTR